MGCFLVEVCRDPFEKFCCGQCGKVRTHGLCLVVGEGPALQRHNTEHSKQIFPENELRGHSPNSYIHVSVSDLYIPTIGVPILLQENKWTDRGNM